MIYFIKQYDEDYAFWYDRVPKLSKAKKCTSLAELRKNNGDIEKDNYGYDGGQFEFLEELLDEDSSAV